MDTYNSEKTISLWENGGRRTVTLINLRTGRKYLFEIKNSYTVGSKKEFCDLQVTTDDRYMSKKHLRFINEADGVYVEDLHSKNGSRVNGKLISARTRIRQGDILRMGRSEFEVIV